VTYIFKFFDMPQLDNYFSFYIFLYIIENTALPAKFTCIFQDDFYMFLPPKYNFTYTAQTWIFVLHKSHIWIFFFLFLTQSSLERCAPITAIFNQVKLTNYVPASVFGVYLSNCGSLPIYELTSDINKKIEWKYVTQI